MKYISKAEDNTHSKALTVTSAVAKALSASNNGHDQGRSMLIKTYNKSRHREVGIPDAISHLLDYSDVLTGATFQNIYTTHLLNHLRRSTMGRTISHQWTLETIIRKFRPSVTRDNVQLTVGENGLRKAKSLCLRLCPCALLIVMAKANLTGN
jgi:hypothetical protein